MGMNFYRGYIYQKIKEEAENLYIMDYLDDCDADIEENIEASINNNIEELLDDDDYDDYDEDELQEVFMSELLKDIDIDALEDSVEERGDDYWGLSSQQRNSSMF